MRAKFSFQFTSFGDDISFRVKCVWRMRAINSNYYVNVYAPVKRERERTGARAEGNYKNNSEQTDSKIRWLNCLFVGWFVRSFVRSNSDAIVLIALVFRLYFVPIVSFLPLHFGSPCRSQRKHFQTQLIFFYLITSKSNDAQFFVFFFLFFCSSSHFSTWTIYIEIFTRSWFQLLRMNKSHIRRARVKSFARLIHSLHLDSINANWINWVKKKKFINNFAYIYADAVCVCVLDESTLALYDPFLLKYVILCCIFNFLRSPSTENRWLTVWWQIERDKSWKLSLEQCDAEVLCFLEWNYWI